MRFSEQEEEESEKHSGHEKKKWHHDASTHEHRRSILVTLFLHLKKISYYLSFFFFYLSLYGIVYGINGIYGFFDLTTVYSLLTLGLSLAIGWVFFVMRPKKNEVVFRLFRSNFIAFSLVYTVLFASYFFLGKTPNFLFVFNSLVSLGGLISILFFDHFLDHERKVYTYIFSLFYSFLLLFFYFHFLFATETTVLFLVLTHLSSIGIFEGLPRIRQFKSFAYISKYIGVVMNYGGLVILSIYMLFSPITWILASILLISVVFQIMVHIKNENYLSFAFALFSLFLLYTKLFFPYLSDSFLSLILFAFGLPIFLSSIAFLVRTPHPLDVYFLHYSGIFFSICFSGYYFLFLSSPTILLISAIFLLQSLLLFFSYLRKK